MEGFNIKDITNVWQMLAVAIPACVGVLTLVRHWINKFSLKEAKKTKERTEKRDGEMAEQSQKTQKLEKRINDIVDMGDDFNKYRVEEMEMKTTINMKLDSIAKNQIPKKDFEEIKDSVHNIEDYITKAKK